LDRKQAIMRTILVLTDFSKNAKHAAMFAARLVEKLRTGVFLYHTYYDGPLIGAYARGSMIIDEFSLLAKESAAKLDQLAVNIRNAVADLSDQDFNPVIDFQSGEGSLGNNISSILKEKQIEMIVMGGSARSTVHNLFFGSDTLSVIDNSFRPVLIIPAEAEMKKLQKVTLATAFELEDINAISYLIELSKVFQYDLEIVHVSLLGKGEDPVKEKAIQSHINAIKQNNITYREIRGKEVIKRLNNLCKDNGSDILALVHHRRGFFSNIFSKSNTEQALFSHRIPLLVIPAEI
jgi:nucleotide-binding universal stress UspA family protein